MRLLVRLHLLQVPGNEGYVAVGGGIGTGTAAVGAGVVVAAPTPLDGAQGLRRRIGGFHGGGEHVGLVAHLVVGVALRMDIAVRAVPQRRFVVEIVIGDAAVGRGAVLADQVSHPAGDEGGVECHAGIGRIVAGDRCAIAEHAVATVGIPGVGGLLRAVFGDLEAAVVGMIRQAALGDPAYHRHGHQRARRRAAVLLDEAIGSGTVR